MNNVNLLEICLDNLIIVLYKEGRYRGVEITYFAIFFLLITNVYCVVLSPVKTSSRPNTIQHTVEDALENSTPNQK